MEKTTIVYTGHVHAEVQIFTDDVKAGHMNFALTRGRLAVFHTEVYPEFEARGFAKLLLDQLVSYAREKELKIIPLCPYVNAQFRRYPDTFKDVWSIDWHQ